MLAHGADINDILPAVDPSKRVDKKAMELKELKKYLVRTGRCSVIIKAADDLSDIFLGRNIFYFIFYIKFGRF